MNQYYFFPALRVNGKFPQAEQSISFPTFPPHQTSQLRLCGTCASARSDSGQIVPVFQQNCNVKIAKKRRFPKWKNGKSIY
jgi:hypothetical protein